MIETVAVLVVVMEAVPMVVEVREAAPKEELLEKGLSEAGFLEAVVGARREAVAVAFQVAGSEVVDSLVVELLEKGLSEAD